MSRIYSKGREIYENGGVSLDYKDSKNTLHFIVKEYYVDVDKWNSYECSCYYGMRQGVNGAFCSHKAAVFFYITDNNSKIEDLKAEGAPVTRSYSTKKEITKTQKKVLRDALTCEKCGEEKIELHRINRKGPYILSNLKPLCKECHKEVHAKEKGTLNK